MHPIGTLFIEKNNGFLATDYSVGPWSKIHQHGSPATMLIGKVLQRTSKLALARLTIEILRPIPVGLISIETERLRPGRFVEIWGAKLYCNKKEIIRASGLFLKPDNVQFDAPANDLTNIVLPQDSQPIPFIYSKPGVNFANSVEMRIAHGKFMSGHAAVWIRPLVTLIEGQPLSALDRLLLVADCGNGIGGFLDIEKYSFINPDLTVYINRLPNSDWVGIDSKSFGQKNGIGLSDSIIFDEQGFIARANQSIIIRKQAKSTE